MSDFILLKHKQGDVLYALLRGSEPMEGVHIVRDVVTKDDESKYYIGRKSYTKNRPGSPPYTGPWYATIKEVLDAAIENAERERADAKAKLEASVDELWLLRSVRPEDFTDEYMSRTNILRKRIEPSFKTQIDRNWTAERRDIPKDVYYDQRCRDCGVEPGSLDATGPCLNDQTTHDWVAYYEVMDIMEIGSGNGYPASTLSNFTPNMFTVDDIQCCSMEGFLQALKFEDENVQVEVCKLVGLAAKRRGQKRNSAWKRAQKLWWRGYAVDRHGQEYQDLLDKAYRAMFDQCPKFRRALVATQNAVLRHSIGNTDSFHTVLTQREFCRRLDKLRTLAKDMKE